MQRTARLLRRRRFPQDDIVSDGRGSGMEIAEMCVLYTG